MKRSYGRKTIYFVISLFLFVTFLFSVGSIGAEGKRITIRAAHWWGGAFDEIFDSFGKKFPDIKVKMEPRPWSGYHDKMLVEMAGGRGADVYFVDSYYYGKFFPMYIFLPLNDFIEKDKDVDIAKFVVDPKFENGYMGKVYTLPQWHTDNPTLWVNKDLCEEAGVGLPEWGTPNFDKWKWDDLLAAARKTTKVDASGKTVQFGVSSPGSWPWIHTVFVWSNGGEIFDKPDHMKETKTLIDQPEAVEAYQFLIDLTIKYHVAPTPAQAQLLQPGTYLSGKVAFNFGWNIYGEMKKADFNWTVIPLPWQKRRATKIGGNSWGILATTKNAEAAWKLIKYFTTDLEAQQMFTKAGTINAYDPDRLMPLAETKEQRVLWEIIRYGVKGDVTFRPWWYGSKNPAKFVDILMAETDLMYEGKSVAQALKDAAAKINKMLAK